MDERPDAQLVAAVLAGDSAAFGALVNRHKDNFARFAARMLNSQDDAEDALQSAFIRAYRNLASCREPDRFGAWLQRIVLNECRTLATRRGKRELRLDRTPATMESLGVSDGSSRKELAEEIAAALQRLPPDQREAFLLRYVEDLGYEEMSELTGAGVSALKMRVKRACESLRALLEGAV